MALAPLSAAAALVSDALAARVAGWQRMIDPLMPALLLLVLMVVAWALVQARRRAHQHAAAGEALAAPFGWRRGLGLGALALGFALLAAAIGGHDTHQRLLQWDAAVVAAAQRGVSPATQQALRWVSDLGDVLVLTPLVLAVFGGLLLRRQRVLALGWLLAVLVNSLAVRVLKGAIGRERPARRSWSPRAPVSPAGMRRARCWSTACCCGSCCRWWRGGAGARCWRWRAAC